MRNFVFLIAFAALWVVSGQDKYYNILALDGGGIRGLIPAEALINLEEKAYQYCTEQKYNCPEYEGDDAKNRVAMKDLFDMISGTSTGSIITAALTYTDKKAGLKDTAGNVPKPGFWAKTIKEIYTKNGGVIFADHKDSGSGTTGVVFFVFVILWGVGFYFIGRHLYDNPETAEQFKRIDEILSNQKRQLKGQEVKHKENLDDYQKKIMDTFKKVQEYNYKEKYAETKEELSKKQEELAKKYEDIKFTNPFGNNDPQIQKTDVNEENLGAPPSKEEQKNQKDKAEMLTDFKLHIGKKLTNGMFNGVKIQGLMIANNLEENKKAKNLIAESKAKFEKDRNKKWVVCAIGVLIGGILGWSLPKITTILTRSVFDRSGLDRLTKELLPGAMVDDATVDEVLICAYDYNSQQPRFYSKYFSEDQPGIYDKEIAVAIAGSSSVPGGFQPQSVPTIYGQEQLIIDGMVIGNNPALYAFMLHSKIKDVKQENIRVLSIGTGLGPAPDVKGDSLSRVDWLALSGELTADVDMEVHNKILERVLNRRLKKKSNQDKTVHLRMNILTTNTPNGIDKANIDGLIQDGQNMYNNYKSKVDKMLEEIIDEKFG